MCGIWGVLGKVVNETHFFDAYNNIKIRGPERSEFFQWKEFINLYLGFHRLSIMDQRIKADQPFIYENTKHKVLVACNGEIYNYKELIEEHDLNQESKSDCEVILWLYLKYGMEKTIELMNGEYALCIIDISKKEDKMVLYLCRDHCGIRPLFYGENNETFAFSSELKGLTYNLGTDNVG